MSTAARGLWGARRLVMHHAMGRLAAASGRRAGPAVGEGAAEVGMWGHRGFSSAAGGLGGRSGSAIPAHILSGGHVGAAAAFRAPHLPAPGAIARVCGLQASAAAAAAPGQVIVGSRGYASKLGKIKSYSSYKKRFRKTASGKYKRTKMGGLHLAFNKTPKVRMGLRKPAMVAPGYAKTLRKLGFKQS